MINKFAFVMLVCFGTLSSCAQESNRSDIADKIQGRWLGSRREITKTINNKIPAEVKFTKDDFTYFIGKSNGTQNYRIFIHSNGDTLIERKPKTFQKMYKNPSYMNLHVINKGEIILYFVFKLDDKTFLNDRSTGLYLKREN